MKRLVAALLSVPFALVVVAAPAQALPKHDDPAKGCDNLKAGLLEGYCDGS